MKKGLTSALVVLVLSIMFSTSVSAADIIDSGYCGGEGDGTNLSWILTSDGMLTISGAGSMAEYSYSHPAPWYSYRSEMKTLVLSDNITTIGTLAFYNCNALNGELVIPNSITAIYTGAFRNCSGLTGKLILPNDLAVISNSAFSDCTGLTGILAIPETVTTIGKYAFERCDGFSLIFAEGNEPSTVYSAFPEIPLLYSSEVAVWNEGWGMSCCYVWDNTVSKSAVSLDLVDGNVDIMEADGITFYSQNGTAHASTGSAIVRQTDSGAGATSNAITVYTGDCSLTISGINVVNAEHSPLRVNSGSSLTLNLVGDNYLSTTKYGCAGLQTYENSNLSIGGTGSLTATCNAYYGAGIGGGHSPACGNITITGGTIIATGTNGAAGIGGGLRGDCGNITITGGNITAIGGNSGAGIGSSQEGICGTISISNATVKATSREGAAIGTGYEGTCGIITIESCDIKASTTLFPYATIGAGDDGICQGVSIDDTTTILEINDRDVNVIETIFIDTQPITTSAHIGNVPLLSVNAHGYSDLDYSWQIFTEQKVWQSLGETNSSTRFTMTEELNGAEIRCALRNGWGNVAYTDTIKIHILDFSQQPMSVDASLNDMVSFAVTPKCSNVAYQWQRSYDNCQTWSNVDGETYSTLIVNATLSESSAKYRCVITATNGDSLASDTVEINLNTGDLVTYTVQFFLQNTDGNGYTLENQLVKEGTADETVTAPDASYDGFSENAVKSTVSGSIANDSSLILTRYFDRNTYSISFEMNGGGSIPAIDALYGASVEAPDEPSRYGYRFAGWYSDENFENEFVFDTMPIDGVTVFAKWEPVGYGRGIEYQINSISIRNCNTYEIIGSIPTNAFLVEVSVTNLSATTTDTIILSYYKENGQFIGMQYLYANPQIGQTLTFGSYVENNNGNIAIIKAFVLPTLGNPIPLASSVEFK